MRDGPADGDVVITTDRGAHYLSIAPHPYRLSFADLQRAVQIAKRWAELHEVEIWHVNHGVAVRFPKDPPGERVSAS